MQHVLVDVFEEGFEEFGVDEGVEVFGDDEDGVVGLLLDHAGVDVVWVREGY